MIWINKLMAGLCIAFLLLSFSMPSRTGAEREQQRVKVGFPLGFGFGYMKNGVYGGYTCDYLQEISHYTGWEYEFVTVGGDYGEQLVKLIAMLEEGEIDVMGGVLRNTETEQIYDFPEYDAGCSYSILSVLADDQRFDDMKYSSFNDMRVGVYGNARKRIGRMEKFFQSYGITPHVVSFPDETKLTWALQNGEVDALLSNDFRDVENERILARFGGEPYYFVTSKGNKEILNGLNTAMAKIRDTNPNLSNELYKKHFRLPNMFHFYMTPEERDYVKRTGVIRVAVNSNWAPIQNLNRKTGQYEGVMTDVLNYISAQSGLRIEFIPTRSYAESIEKLAAGEADLFAGAIGDDRFAARYDFVMSAAVMPLQMVTIRNKSVDFKQEGERILALPHGYIYPEPYPEEKIRRYDNIQQCVEAVESGEADFCYGNNLVIEYYTRDQYFENIAMIGSTGDNEVLSIAFSKPVPVELLTIVNKGIMSLSKGQLQEFIDKNTILSDRQMTFKALIRSNPSLAISVVLLIAAIIIAAVVYVSVVRIRQNRKAALDNARYRLLSELSNEYIYEYDYEQDVLSASEKLMRLCGCAVSVENFLSDGALQDEAAALGADFAATLLKGDLVSEFSITIAGREIWMRNSCSTIVDAQQLPLRRIGKLTDITMEKQEREGLMEKAQRDSMTGIFNKGTTEHLIVKYLQHSSPAENSLLILFDVDNFKTVNDNYGHIFGDVVLREVAATLQANCRNADIAGRVGGDEFAVFLKDVAEGDAVRRVEQLSRMLRVTYPENAYTVGISMGVTVAAGGEEYLTVFRRADLALYRAKRLGRNQYCLYTPELESAAVSAANLN